MEPPWPPLYRVGQSVQQANKPCEADPAPPCQKSSSLLAARAGPLATKPCSALMRRRSRRARAPAPMRSAWMMAPMAAMAPCSVLRAPFSIPSPWCVAHLTAPRHPVRDFHYPILCDPELMAPCMPARFANVPGGWPQVALYRGPALTFWPLMSPLRRLESARSPLASGLYIQGQGPMRLGRPRPFLPSSLQTLNLDSNLTISLFDFSSDQ